jgi:hypothetical protein
MDARLRCLALAVLLLAAKYGRAEPSPAERILPLIVRDGRCEFTLPAERPDAKYLLIVGALSESAGPFRVQLSTASAAVRSDMPIANTAANADWLRKVSAQRDRMDRAQRTNGLEAAAAPAADPPKQRTFYLFTQERDFTNRAGYTAVTGELAAVGRHGQVYIDRDCAERSALQPTVKDALRTFDDEVFPQADKNLGRVLDVDRDGRFTLLFTGWLGKLCNGKVSLGGFVRGSDFERDLPAPYSNHCDMLYLNTDLNPGPHLRTLLAHEYTHAVCYCEHVFGDYLPNGVHEDEQSWLNEALAHLNEDRHGYSWSNIDYRVSAFLAAPQRYRLVVADYYDAGLWRDAGTRGATYLFLRWCADRFGPQLPTRLIRSNLVGTANLEAATGVPFAEVFRQWCVALALGTDAPAPLRRINLHGQLGDKLLSGPRMEALSLRAGKHAVTLAGTSAAYFMLQASGARASCVSIMAEPQAELQVTLIRLQQP